jgi:predicted metalloprotease
MKINRNITWTLAVAALICAPGAKAQQRAILENTMTQIRMIQAGVTQADLSAMRAKNDMAISYLRGAWREIFAGNLQAYLPPIFQPFTVSAGTSACPVIQDNAEYCSADHTIYYDEVFLASVMKSAARNLGTDGDFAPIVILAHEFGHAVAIEKGYRQRVSLLAENAADCMAGVIAARAQRDGHIDRGDLEEARFALSSAADPPNRSILTQLHDPAAHGDWVQRIGAFTSGLRSGDVRVCVPTPVGISRWSR